MASQKTLFSTGLVPRTTRAVPCGEMLVDRADHHEDDPGRSSSTASHGSLVSQRSTSTGRSQKWRERSGRSRLRRPGRRRQRRPSARRRPRAASRDPSRLPRSLRGGRVPGGKTWGCSRRAHEAVGKVSSRWRPTAAKRSRRACRCSNKQRHPRPSVTASSCRGKA